MLLICDMSAVLFCLASKIVWSGGFLRVLGDVYLKTSNVRQYKVTKLASYGLNDLENEKEREGRCVFSI